MGTIGHGFGSEWHLLRYLGYHRNTLNKKIKQETGATVIHWLDFDFSGKSEPLHQDREYEGLNFLPPDEIPAQWANFWPQSGSAPNWDAVAQLRFADESEEWLLVEAKAHIGEFKSACHATDPASVAKIESAIEHTREVVGASAASQVEWMEKYYQYANRLAVLAFLNNLLPASPCVPANPSRLLYICFCGDTHSGCDCPKDAAAWTPALKAKETALGIFATMPLMQRVHHIYLDVNK